MAAGFLVPAVLMSETHSRTVFSNFPEHIQHPENYFLVLHPNPGRIWLAQCALGEVLQRMLIRCTDSGGYRDLGS